MNSNFGMHSSTVCTSNSLAMRQNYLNMGLFIVDCEGLISFDSIS